MTTKIVRSHRMIDDALSTWLRMRPRPLFNPPSVRAPSALRGAVPRIHPAKKEVRIFDYVDRDVPMLVRMFERRRCGYRAIGYTSGEMPMGYGERGDEVVLEYDEDVLRELEERDEFL